MRRDGRAAMISSGGDPAPSSSVLQLEQFLDSVLHTSLRDILTQRDELYATVGQCAQLRWLLEDMRALSRRHSFIAAASAREEAAAAGIQTDGSHRDEDDATGCSSGLSPTTARTRGAASNPPRRNRVLVDLGHHFYTPAIVRDAETIYLHLGCGVVLPMPTDDAGRFLSRKESVVRRMILSKSKEALRVKYRIRLVKEAIARLHEQQTGLSL